MSGNAKQTNNNNTYVTVNLVHCQIKKFFLQHYLTIETRLRECLLSGFKGFMSKSCGVKRCEENLFQYLIVGAILLQCLLIKREYS